MRFYELPPDLQDELIDNYDTSEMVKMGLHPADHDEYGTPEHDQLVELGMEAVRDLLREYSAGDSTELSD